MLVLGIRSLGLAELLFVPERLEATARKVTPTGLTVKPSSLTVILQRFQEIVEKCQP
jgi:hypothetical protein